MTPRTILDIFEAPISRHGTALTTRDATEQVLGADMDPFIVVSLYDMVGPTFPPHPHAGFAVATYILPESKTGFINQDSLGNKNAIPPGALHVTVAGSGVIHEEQPEETGVMARGFQIWIDLANGARAVAPHALTLQADQVPISHKDGATIRSVLGDSNGLTSPLTLSTDVRLIDVTLEPAAGFSQELATSENAFILLLDGSATINGRLAQTGELVRTAPNGDTLNFVAGPQGARFTLFAGQPLRQPRAQRGPMVAGDQAELSRFMAAYTKGQFGTLQPFAQQAQA
jgi:redox-sensitive bicupin YhaK (pirin superfamily)